MDKAEMVFDKLASIGSVLKPIVRKLTGAKARTAKKMKVKAAKSFKKTMADTSRFKNKLKPKIKFTGIVNRGKSGKKINQDTLRRFYGASS